VPAVLVPAVLVPAVLVPPGRRVLRRLEAGGPAGPGALHRADRPSTPPPPFHV